MSISIRIDKELYLIAKKEAKLENRTISGQIRHWSKIGKAITEERSLEKNNTDKNTKQ